MAQSLRQLISATKAQDAVLALRLEKEVLLTRKKPALFSEFEIIDFLLHICSVIEPFASQNTQKLCLIPDSISLKKTYGNSNLKFNYTVQISKSTNSNAFTAALAIYYEAPESKTKLATINEVAATMYSSLGVILYEMVTGNIFVGAHLKGIAAGITPTDIKQLLMYTISTPLMALIDALLQTDPRRRPTFAQLQNFVLAKYDVVLGQESSELVTKPTTPSPAPAPTSSPPPAATTTATKQPLESSSLSIADSLSDSFIDGDDDLFDDFDDDGSLLAAEQESIMDPKGNKMAMSLNVQFDGELCDSVTMNGQFLQETFQPQTIQELLGRKNDVKFTIIRIHSQCTLDITVHNREKGSLAQWLSVNAAFVSSAGVTPMGKNISVKDDAATSFQVSVKDAKYLPCYLVISFSPIPPGLFAGFISGLRNPIQFELKIKSL